MLYLTLGSFQLKLVLETIRTTREPGAVPATRGSLDADDGKIGIVIHTMGTMRIAIHIIVTMGIVFI